MNYRAGLSHQHLSKTETKIKWIAKNDVDFGIVETPFQK